MTTKNEGHDKTATVLNYHSPIIAKYGIIPDQVEQIGKKLVKVHSKSGTFALKRLDGKYKDGSFIKTMQSLFERGFTNIIPIYRTNNGNFLVHFDNNCFYLMPWFQHENRQGFFQQMMRELARLHYMTSKDIVYTNNQIAKSYNDIKASWRTQRVFLERYMEVCESKWYMSPFELQFVTYFHEIMQAIHFAERNLDQWFERTEQKKHSRVSIVHGNVSPEHVVSNDKGKGYFINFERSSVASPVYDLVTLIHRTLKTYPVNNHECVEWIQHYQQFNSLKEEERFLLYSYGSYPEQLYNIVRKHLASSTNNNELQSTEQLLRAYWQMKNIEFVIMQLIDGEKMTSDE
ncbi:spore coat protein YsxE [Bacillus sp. SCS-151]|uniref:spore coat protein YsxE n=1 Tax=Nanhaiella sioensis TaxID=3115293 RepID=UPI00397AB0EE